MTKEISVDIQEKGGIIYCTIKAPRQDYQFPKKIIFNDCDVKELLLKKGYNKIELLKSSHVNNKGAETPCEGTWEFKKIKPPIKRRRTAKSNSSKK